MRRAVTGANEKPTRSAVRRGVIATLALTLLWPILLGLGAQSASALDEPTVPEEVAGYFSSGLVPRLEQLYGTGSSAVEVDSTSSVGTIHRVSSFTAGFLAGSSAGAATELTNNWIADVSTNKKIVGVATVWINPTSDQPELATFDIGDRLASRLAAAPQGTLLVRDDAHAAWFATDGETATPLLTGNSGITAKTNLADIREAFGRAGSAPAEDEGSSGLLIAVLVLGIVVVLLGIFVLLPDRRRLRRRTADASAKATSEPPLAVPQPTDPEPREPDPEPAAPTPATRKPTGESAAAKPSAAKPAAAKPSAAKPRATKSSAAKPPVSKPAARKPAARKPAPPKLPDPLTPTEPPASDH